LFIFKQLQLHSPSRYRSFTSLAGRRTVFCQPREIVSWSNCLWWLRVKSAVHSSQIRLEKPRNRLHIINDNIVTVPLPNRGITAVNVPDLAVLAYRVMHTR